MNENSTLDDLSQRLEQSKKAELEKQQQIELESMNEFLKSLKTSLQTELDLIKDDIYKVQKFVNSKNNTLAKNAEQNAKEITQSFQSVSQELTKLKAKQWIIPTVMGLAIVLALALGTWGVTKYLESQLQALQELREVIAQTEKTKDKYIVKSWSNGIGVENEPRVFKSQEEGLWIVQFEKSN